MEITVVKSNAGMSWKSTDFEALVQSKAAQLQPKKNIEKIVGSANQKFQSIDNDIVTIRQSPTDELEETYNAEVKRDDDNPAIGILLCTEKGKKLVEYATAGMDNHLFVSKYLLQLPQKEQLEAFILNEMEAWK